MASSSKQPVPKEKGLTSVEEELYRLCSAFPPEKLFSQQDLAALNLLPENDTAGLQSCTQHIVQKGLFRIMIKDGKIHWRVVTREEAAR